MGYGRNTVSVVGFHQYTTKSNIPGGSKVSRDFGAIHGNAEVGAKKPAILSGCGPLNLVPVGQIAVIPDFGKQSTLRRWNAPLLIVLAP